MAIRICNVRKCTVWISRKC